MEIEHIVIYDKETNEVIISKHGEYWVYPTEWGIAVYRNGEAPKFEEVDGVEKIDIGGTKQ